MPVQTSIIMVLLMAGLVAMGYPSSLYAAAAVAGRQQQMQSAQQAQVEAYKQAQEQAQMQAYQEAVAQRQSQEMQAYQQQLIMQQVVQEQINQEIQAYVQAQRIQAAQQEMVRGIVMQELAKQMAQAQAQQVQQAMVVSAVSRAVEQAALQRADVERQAVVEQVHARAMGVQAAVVSQEIAHRQQVMAAKAVIDVAENQKMTAMRNQIALEGAATQKQYEVAVAKQLGQQAMAGVDKPFEQVMSDDVKELVDISDVWKSLDKKAAAWVLLIDNQAKVLTVTEYMERFRKEGAKISQEPMHYVQVINDMVTQNPPMLQMPFKELLQIAAIIDYDFDNGGSRDELARKILGPGYEANKRRLGR